MSMRFAAFPALVLRRCSRTLHNQPRVLFVRSTHATNATSSRMPLSRPPPRRPRDQGQIRDPARMQLIAGRVVKGLIAVNGAVFLAWQYAQHDWRTNNSSRLVTYMLDNFTLSVRNLDAGRWWTVFTCMVSHKDLGHFVFNTMGIYSFGPTVCALLGPGRFLAFYTTAALAGSATSLAEKANSGRPSWSLGASAAVMGVVTFWACLVPQSSISLMFIPMKAWQAVGGVVAFDLFNTISGKHILSIDSAAHLGGNALGLAYFLFLKRFRLR